MQMKNSRIKVALIGAGSTYTPELIEGIIERHEGLPVGELYLMDIDSHKLEIVGQLSQRMINKAQKSIHVVLTEDLDEALVGADFVLAQIRVGGLACRILDEKIPLKYGFIGQETTGIGGFFKALRTIPVMLHIAKRMEELCPEAWLINFSNPSGILAQALSDYSSIKAIGLCNVPINMMSEVAKFAGDDVAVEYLGLNHLSFITAIYKDNKDILASMLRDGFKGTAMKNIPAQGFETELLKTVQAIPSSYLEYFYFKDHKLEVLRNEELSRGEVCQTIEEQLLKQYEDQDLSVKPEELSKRGGARYSEAAISLVDAIYNDKQEVHVINTKNEGALGFMRDSDVVEIGAIMGKTGCKPVAIPDFCNEHVMAIMQVVKAYERHTVEAAVKGSDEEAMLALMIHPLVGDYHQAKACYEEMKEAHKAYLPQFK